MIIGMIGGMGTGKTLSSVRYLYNYYRSGYRILSNIKLNFPHEKIGLQDLLDFANANMYLDNTIVFIDEAGTILDSRLSGSKRNRLVSFFIVLTRKLGCNVIYTTQRYNMVDKRLRQNTDIIINCNTKEYRGEKFTHNLIMIMKGFGMKIKNDYFRSKEYYDYYDTRELVKIE
jgi:hypothetical protein